MYKRLAIIFLLSASAAIFLTGCLKFDVDMGIDERYSSYLSYTVEMDVSDIDPQYRGILEAALHNLGWHYQENLGFVVGINNESDIITLTMKAHTENDSFADAFDSLKAMLINEQKTAFTRVDMSAESFSRQDSFIITATVDIPFIIRQSNIADLPPDLAMQLDNFLPVCGGSVTLTIPVSELVYSSHDTDVQYRLATMAVPFDFSEQTSLELRGNVVYSADGMRIDTADEEIERLAQTKDIVFVVCAASLALLLIILLITLLRIRVHNRMFD